MRKILFSTLLFATVLALISRMFAKPASARATVSNVSYDEVASFKAIDAYIEEQMKRLKIPGASLAIVEGDEIVHQSGFGQARPGGESPSPTTSFFMAPLPNLSQPWP